MITSKCKIPLTDKLLFFKNYIDKQIEIGISNKNKLTGIFCTYDPLSGSIAISNKDVMIINSKCITYIKCLDEDPVENILFTVDNIENSNGSTYETMKLNLKNCLEERLFNVQVEGDILNIDDICIIKPPYGAQQCICDDPIKLELIEDLIRQLATISTVSTDCEKDAASH